MPTIQTIVKRKKDTTPAVDVQAKEELRFEHAVILEAGMSSGKTSVSFGLTNQKGEYFIAQTSAAILEVLVGAIKGAEAHWRDNP